MSWISEKIKRILFSVLGTLFLGFGCIGVLLPIVPTTPFLLLAAACYIRGSKRLHQWMMRNQIFGAFLRNYLERKGITSRHKLFTLTFLWVMISLTIFYIRDNSILPPFLFIIAFAVSVHILKLPTLKSPSK
ncbi:MAG: YbaN family protein [Candidatus Hermodarchaeia archaeon]|jgi:uncharacterized membrane protein YbaN (DUF454 family)